MRYGYVTKMFWSSLKTIFEDEDTPVANKYKKENNSSIFPIMLNGAYLFDSHN